MDKWKETSLYDIDWKTTTDDGEEVTFTFKPLLGKDFVKAFGLFNKLSELPQDIPEEEMMKHIDEELVGSIHEVAVTVVKRSYPDKSEEDIELFVGANLFNLIEPITKLVVRESKKNPRKVAALSK